MQHGLGDQTVDVVQDHEWWSLLSEEAVESLQVIRTGRRLPHREVSPNALRLDLKVVLNDRRIPLRSGGLPKRRPIAQLGRREAVRFGGTCIRRWQAGNVPCSDGQKNKIGFERIEARNPD